MRKTSLLLGIAIAAALLAVAAVACDDDDEEEDGGEASPQATPAVDETAPAEGSTVDVTLVEWAVELGADSAPAGGVTFNATNAGAETHEFVVVATDLDPSALPTIEDGSVDEAGEGIEIIDEIEDIAAGSDGSVTVDLAAGNYALICNIVEEEEDGTLESHYTEGMYVGFTVAE